MTDTGATVPGPRPAATEQPLDGRHEPPGRTFWIAMGVGALVVAFGAVGLVTAEGSGLSSFIPWFVGGALLLDLVIVPTAAAIGALGRRVLPGWAWRPVRVALVTSTTLVAFALPLVLDLGGNPGNASVRPRDYGSGLLTALAVTWVVTLVALGASWAADRSRPPS